MGVTIAQWVVVVVVVVFNRLSTVTLSSGLVGSRTECLVPRMRMKTCWTHVLLAEHVKDPWTVQNWRLEGGNVPIQPLWPSELIFPTASQKSQLVDLPLSCLRSQ